MLMICLSFVCVLVCGRLWVRQREACLCCVPFASWEFWSWSGSFRPWGGSWWCWWRLWTTWPRSACCWCSLYSYSGILYTVILKGEMHKLNCFLSFNYTDYTWQNHNNYFGPFSYSVIGYIATSSPFIQKQLFTQGALLHLAAQCPY